VEPETAVANFFGAMNAHDPDAAGALVADGVQVAFGPSHVFTGRDAVRELALQEHPELVFETVPVGFETDGQAVTVNARRTQRWRADGEIAAEEELEARFLFDAAGLISRVELS
jgi:hypothetical protein